MSDPATPPAGIAFTKPPATADAHKPPKRKRRPPNLEHQFSAAAYLFVSPEEAEYAEANGRLTVPELTTVDVAELLCLRCMRKYVDVKGKPCVRGSRSPRDTDHLRGGKPNGERTPRLEERRGHYDDHPGECEARGCWRGVERTARTKKVIDLTSYDDDEPRTTLDDDVHPADR